ncbi:MAG: CPBP family glutamic-type intramembrane protease [Planctomycetia bacterium]|nr:CPBP family glutamic-type intramembrane protease [Planctomycetia bacterium]
MKNQKQKLNVAILIAFVLWGVMFSPWTASRIPFWPMMSLSAGILLMTAFGFRHDWRDLLQQTPRSRLRTLLYGFALAAFLWGIFWIGDKASSFLFGFASGQVDHVYTLKEGISPWTIGLLLLILIGPAEEIFWRGYVQRTLADLYGPNRAMFFSIGVYALVHLFSFNFMLLAAAAVLGCVWSFLFRLSPKTLPTLIVSHALWDTAVFVLFPFR